MAEASDIAKVRRRIGDRSKAAADTATGNGDDRVYELRFDNVSNVVVKFDGIEQTTGYTVDAEAGAVTFDAAPTDGTSIDISYTFAAYADSEIGDLIDDLGVSGAVVECLEELLSDAARFYDYVHGQTKASKSQVFDHLKSLLDRADGRSGTNAANVTIGKRYNSTLDDPKRTRIDLSRLDEEVLK